MSALPAESREIPAHALSAHHHAARVRTLLEALTKEVREDLPELDEPKAQALFETAAEVLQGLHAAFDHYERGAEAAMRE